MSVTSLIRAEMAGALAAGLLLGLLLLALRPNERPRVRNALLVLGLCAIVELADGLMVSLDRKSTRLNSSHIQKSRMPSSA